MSALFLALAIGGLAGVVAALCGVGGGIIMVPLFVHFFHHDQKQAVATSLAAIIATSIAASVANSRNNFIEWRVALPAALGGALVAWLAGEQLKRFSNESLQILFALLLLAVGGHMLAKAMKWV
jgi:uncharacterized protein